MRISIALLFLAGCDKGVPPSPPPVPVPPPTDAAIDAAIDAPPPLVKLVDKTPALGLRAGAWMDVQYLEGAHVMELRVTAPRVTKLAIQVGEATPTIVALDPDAKAPQVIPVDAVTDMRIAIAGLRAAGRGRAANIELWGRPSNHDYMVPPTVSVTDGRSGPCPGLAKEIEAWRIRDERDRASCNDPGCEDLPGPPDCRLEPLEIDLPEPWREAVRFCSINDTILGDATCTVAVSTAAGSALAIFPTDRGGHQPLDVDAKVEDGNLVFTYFTDWRVDTKPTTVVCRPNPLSCSNR